MFILTVAAITFGVVFLSELPDRTALAGLVLGTRYRPAYVFCGVAAAFVVHVVLAIVAGNLLTLLPQRLLEAVVTGLFLAGAAILIFRKDKDETRAATAPKNPRFWRVAGAGFGVVLVAEFGDLTQIMTANLAARYQEPLAVGLGAVLALWSVAALTIVGGKALLRWVPMRLITRFAAGVMLALAGFSCYEAVTG